VTTPLRNQLGKRIAPGFWEDAEGHPHWSIPELLELVNLPDTPENCARVTAMIREQVLKVNPEASIIERETPED